MTQYTWRPEWKRRTRAEKRERAERRCERRATREANRIVDELLDAGHAVDGATIVSLYGELLAEERQRLADRRRS